MEKQTPENILPGELINAVRFSSIETVRALLAQGANVNEKDAVGNTPLMYAAGRKGHIETARLLIANGAFINEANVYGNTALIRAVSFDNAELVRFLIDNNASLGERNNRGHTALGLAEVSGFSEVALILKQAAEVNRKIAAERARINRSHAIVAEKQAHLKKIARPFKLKYN